MDLGLRGKRVLVTGSTAGIGHAAAELFAQLFAMRLEIDRLKTA